MGAKKFKILFVTSELFPFVKTGGLADVSASLPQRLTEMGHEVRIAVPKYGAIDSRKYKIHDVVRLKDLSVKVGSEDVEFSVKSSFLPSQKVRVQIYFIDNEQYFGNRKSLYTDPLTGKAYDDNDERFILFSKSIFELVQKLGWVPDIIHCNDWQCALAPVFKNVLYKDDPQFQQIKILLTIHNFSNTGEFNKSSFEKTGLPNELNSERGDGIIHKKKLSFLKAGLLFADAINTVSEAYANQMMKDKDIGTGLHRVALKRKEDLHGVLNGIDYTVWNPEKDKYIPKKFSLKNLKNKEANKKALLERFRFEYKEGTPVIGMIAQLYDYKGVDLLADAFNELMKRDVIFLLLGTGDRAYHKKFDQFTRKYPDKFACFLGFSDELAHLMEAGLDMLLMPSKYEPCGLNQMYSLVYGTVPIVRQTGGLADTVQRYNSRSGEGTGFMFKEYSKTAMLKEIDRALKTYNNKEAWEKIIRVGMKEDFSWVSSAKRYVELYKKVLSS